MVEQPLEVRVAVLNKTVEDNQRNENECRANNREEHEKIYDRLRETEKQLALIGQRVAMWAAVGAVAGSAIISAIMYKLQH